MGELSWSASYFWHRILRCLEDKLGSLTVSAWFDQTKVVTFCENKLVLEECSIFRRELISKRYVCLIQEVVQEEFGIAIEVILQDV